MQFLFLVGKNVPQIEVVYCNGINDASEIDFVTIPSSIKCVNKGFEPSAGFKHLDHFHPSWVTNTAENECGKIEAPFLERDLLKERHSGHVAPGQLARSFREFAVAHTNALISMRSFPQESGAIRRGAPGVEAKVSQPKLWFQSHVVKRRIMG
ncbi:hypothetical protein TNCV_3849361 [Trichonephila clavipes]|uniref:Uncharacterized protein n=1 Tax=Trichonephila clavipes TaxID=2585209 RepID=A0A8X6US43_TRICX|nr:hypothetical protein TNCV_3849361 [Trichonephila clavipes]